MSTVPATLIGTYTIDPSQSRIGFIARHYVVTKMRNSFDGSGDFDAVNPAVKGVTRSVNVDFDYTGSAVDPQGNQRIGFEDAAAVNRTDWGVNGNAALEAGGVPVSEKVTLECDVSAIRAAYAA